MHRLRLSRVIPGSALFIFAVCLAVPAHAQPAPRPDHGPNGHAGHDPHAGHSRLGARDGRTAAIACRTPRVR